MRAKPLFAGISRVKPGVPLEGAEVLRAQAARIAGSLGRRVTGTIVSVLVVIDTGAGSVGLIGDDRPQDADAEPEAETPAKAATAELNWGHDRRGRRAQGHSGAAGAAAAVAAKGAKATASASGHVHFSMGLLLGPCFSPLQPRALLAITRRPARSVAGGANHAALHAAAAGCWQTRPMLCAVRARTSAHRGCSASGPCSRAGRGAAAVFCESSWTRALSGHG